MVNFWVPLICADWCESYNLLLGCCILEGTCQESGAPVLFSAEGLNLFKESEIPSLQHIVNKLRLFEIIIFIVISPTILRIFKEDGVSSREVVR